MDSLSEQKPSVTTLQPALSAVRIRVRRRCQLLRAWLDEGVPADYVKKLPTSLRAAARWDDPAIGIVPIPSPNDFSRAHPVWGGEVSEIHDLIGELNKRYPKRGSRARAPALARSADASPINESAEDPTAALTAAVSQWHMARAANGSLRDELMRSKASRDDMQTQLAQAGEIIEALSREVASLRKPRPVR